MWTKAIRNNGREKIEESKENKCYKRGEKEEKMTDF